MSGTIRPLLTADAIAARIQALAAEIRRDNPGAELHFIGVLKGSVFFMTDLLRAMAGAVTMDFIAVSSYAGTRTTGEVRLLKDADHGLQDRHVVIVEDIVDTGLTLTYLQDLLKARGPASLRTACLLSKPSRRKVAVPVDYIGFEIADHFVVGYGLDFDEHYRHLPSIGVLTA
ncbi:MAG: hypoxanthine phosphoribosyltransferase [Vicinamibacterales bacterium]